MLDEVAEWQNRPLDICYPLVFFDAIRVKVRDEGFVRNKAIYIALGILPEGTKEILGIWIEQTEGAKFWLRVMNELKNRGAQDILIAVVDGLKGFPEAINAVFPQTIVQTCIVHLIRHSMDFASWKDRDRYQGVGAPPCHHSEMDCCDLILVESGSRTGFRCSRIPMMRVGADWGDAARLRCWPGNRRQAHFPSTHRKVKAIKASIRDRGVAHHQAAAPKIVEHDNAAKTHAIRFMT